MDTYGHIPLHYAAYNDVPEEIVILLVCEYPEGVSHKRFMDERTPHAFAEHKKAPKGVLDILSLSPQEVRPILPYDFASLPPTPPRSLI